MILLILCTEVSSTRNKMLLVIPGADTPSVVIVNTDQLATNLKIEEIWVNHEEVAGTTLTQFIFS